MLNAQRLISLAALLTTLTGCAGGPLADSLQRSLEADSQLTENPPFATSGDSTPTVAPNDVEILTPMGNQTLAPLLPLTSSPWDLAAVIPDNEPVFGPSYPNNAETNPSLDNPPNSPPITRQTQNFNDLSQAPTDLQPYLLDLVDLELLLLNPSTTEDSDNSTTSAAFQPNQPISRREFARWLVAVNNHFHQDNPAQKIRLGNASDTPAFQDLSTTDPDFPAIQGLAEAGIIPSTLTGSATTVNFRPDAQLTREDLLTWKVPLDIRRTLPDATIQAIEETWGFQDAAQIDPAALRAILTDHTLGDFANIRRGFGFTTLLQPQKAVTRAEAAATLWRFGTLTEGITAAEIADRAKPASHGNSSSHSSNNSDNTP